MKKKKKKKSHPGRRLLFFFNARLFSRSSLELLENGLLGRIVELLRGRRLKKWEKLSVKEITPPHPHPLPPNTFCMGSFGVGSAET